MSTPFTIGVAGHVDHGKTTLVRALTGIDTDRKAEEKVRGLSIEAGVAELKLPSGRSVALIDVPGHTDFLKNTIRGLNSVDMAILVVAANDGVMPQTREHVEILKSFHAGSGLVVLSKTDLVDEETLDLAELELNELLGGSFLEQRPILKFTHQRP
ncbi:MAG: GTP-binding protein, partial [Desulfobacteraceae bacterium]